MSRRNNNNNQRSIHTLHESHDTLNKVHLKLNATRNDQASLLRMGLFVIGYCSEPQWFLLLMLLLLVIILTHTLTRARKNIYRKWKFELTPTIPKYYNESFSLKTHMRHTRASEQGERWREFDICEIEADSPCTHILCLSQNGWNEREWSENMNLNQILVFLHSKYSTILCVVRAKRKKKWANSAKIHNHKTI